LKAVVVGATPVPLSGISCVAPVALRELSTKVASPVSAPTSVGLKLMLRLHCAAGASELLAAQSSRVPLPATWFQLALTEREVRSSVALPLFWIWVDCGLSLLVWPTMVAAKLNGGGVENSSS
jgi:hypothetical protein